jgi:DegV family protein with EDD domain
MTVAIVTDSGSDLTPAQLAEAGIRQVSLTASFGEESFLSPDQITPEEFWRRTAQPGCPLAHTAAPSVGQFMKTFEEAFSAGHEGIVCVCLSAELSATVKHAQMAREMMPDKEIFVVDSRSASMACGSVALTGSAMSAGGAKAEVIAQHLERLVKATNLYVALDTLEWLRKGGRISPAKAAIGGLLSIKPIITVVDGAVVMADQQRTRTKATARVIELLTQRPLVGLHVMYSPPTDADAFRDAVLSQLPGPAPKLVTTQILGPVIGAHIGPGAYGAIMVHEVE